MGEIRFVGTGETRGYPYPVCKKINVIMIDVPGERYSSYWVRCQLRDLRTLMTKKIQAAYVFLETNFYYTDDPRIINKLYIISFAWQ